MKKVASALILSAVISQGTSFADNQTFQQSENNKQEISTILLAQNKAPMYSSETKEEISEEAQLLIRDLKGTLEHTGKFTKKIATPIIKKISYWIQKNYDKLPDEKKEKIKKFVGKIKLNFKASIGFFKQLFQDFIEIRKDIEKDTKNLS